jgi:transcriptional regulator with XRE-family HTH domain
MPTGGHQGAREFDGQLMRAVREGVGMSRAKLAEKVGVAESTLLRYEHGLVLPQSRRVAALARGLGVRPEELLAASEVAEGTLRYLRLSAGLRQADLVGKLRIGRTRYAAMERGEGVALSDADRAALAKAFHVSERAVQAAHAASRAAYLSGAADP